MMTSLLDKFVFDEQNYNLSVSDEMHLKKQKTRQYYRVF